MFNFLDALTTETNFGLTENGAIKHNTTKSMLLDMFAMGGAMRNRSDEDCILMFKNAFEENETYALKCLFYLRDCRGGQGERRFWRVCMKWLAKEYPEAAMRNIKNVPLFGRWDDLYVFVGTPAEAIAFEFIKEQLALDVHSNTPSLLAKWLKSENTSSAESRRLAKLTRKHLGFTSREYRKTLSILRERINVVERLMSAGEWDKIEFDKIPSKAGLIYKNAFARHDLERQRAGTVSYEDFAKDTSTKVNAGALYPYEVVEEALRNVDHDWWHHTSKFAGTETDRAMINKYWNNLTDYFKGSVFNGLAVVDTSGSMSGTPIDVAISLGLYCAERAKGPFANHYISFASRPQLIKTEGVDFVDKVMRIYETNLVDNTNIEAVFDLLLSTALQYGVSQEDLPQNIIIISDQEFDAARGCYGRNQNTKTLMENIEQKWLIHGYNIPNLIYWNVDARQNNIAMIPKDGISFVSGFSPSIFQQIMSGKTAFDLMYEVLNQERYSVIM